MVAGHLQIKKGYYYMVLNLKDEHGKRKTKWIPTQIKVGGKKAEKQAEDMLLETRCSYKDPVTHKATVIGARLNSKMLFSEYMLKWLDIIKNSVEETTYAGYATNIKKRIAPYFEELNIRLEELTALDIESFYEYCFNELGVKGSTVQHYHANIHKALKYATRHDLITINPMEKVDRPRAEDYVGEFLTISEVEDLFRIARNDPLEYAIYMAAFYGLRRSELVGLKWSAIDFEKNIITIEHTVTQLYSGGERKLIQKDRAKNKSSRRSMPLVPQFKLLLMRMMERQRNCEKFCGNCYTKTDYVFVNDMGVPYTPNYITQHFALLLKKNNFRRIRFHDLRHTCASLLLKNGVPMKDIQEWLGHSDYSTTANIYAHLDVNSKNVSASSMNDTMTINAMIPVTI